MIYHIPAGFFLEFKMSVHQKSTHTGLICFRSFQNYALKRVAFSGNYEIVAISTDKNALLIDLDYKAVIS